MKSGRYQGSICRDGTLFFLRGEGASCTQASISWPWIFKKRWVTSKKRLRGRLFFCWKGLKQCHHCGDPCHQMSWLIRCVQCDAKRGFVLNVTQLCIINSFCMTDKPPLMVHLGTKHQLFNLMKINIDLNINGIVLMYLESEDRI